MATLGLDTSAYERGIDNVQSETKKTVTALSSEYSKTAKSVLELTKQYNESAAKTGKTSAETKELKNQLAAAEAQLKTTASALKSANNGMDSFGKSASSTGSGLTAALTKSQLLASAISTLSTAALSGAKQFVSMGIEYNAQIESYRVGLTNMLGDAEAANEAMAAIQQDAARTPFSVDSLTQANQLLISAGENAGYSRKVIMALGDAVSATGGGNVELSRMAANLQQIANVGKASAIDIKQFAYAGINVYQVLADYTGKSVQEVQNMTISYDLLSEALIAASEEGGRYYNAMNDLSETANGKTSTLKDNIKQLAGLMTADFSSALVKIEGHLNEIVVAAQEAYKTDGWEGLILKLTGLEEVGKRVGATFAGIAAQVKAMASGDLSEWKAFFDPTGQSGTAYKKAYSEYLGNKNAGTKDDNYWKQYGDRMAKQYGITGTETKSSIPASSSTGTSTGKSSTAKAAADTKKLADTVTETSKQILAGTGNIVGNIQRVVETADNTYNVFGGTTKKLKGTTKETVETITDSWKEVVDGTEKTVKSVTKKVTDAAGNVTTTTQKTSDDVALSVTELQNRIDSNLSEVQKQWSNGIFGRLQNAFTDLKNRNWTGLATDVAMLIWGEVSQGQRKIISDWAVASLKAINDSYSGGGLKAAFEQLQNLFTNGIAADATEAKTAVQSFGEILDGLGNSGGVGEKLAGIATSFSSMSGSVISSLGGIVSFITANPILAAILGITALAGGIALGSFLKKKSSAAASAVTSSTLSYKDIQDAYWYGNQRAYAGYDFMQDRYAMPSYQSGGKLTAYQEKMQASVDALYNVVQQYLPQAGNQVIKLDDGTLVGALAPSIDAQLGHLATLAERGN